MTGRWGDRVSALGFIAFSLYMGGIATEFPAGGGIFPHFATGAAIALSIALIAEGVLRKERAAPREARGSSLKPAALTVLTIVYVLAIFELGYFASTLAYLFAATALVGIRNLKAVALTAAVLLPAMYVFFVVLLQAELPRGWLI